MKKISKVLILLFSIFMFCEGAKAAKNPYKKELSWGGVNCTWYAWQKVYDETGVALAGFGNAKDWYSDAAKKGYTVGSEPRAKAVVVWDNYLNYGHVGYVERVEGDTIYVWDTANCYREMTKEENDKYFECIENNTTSEADSYKCDHLFVTEQIPCVHSGKIGDNGLVGYIYTDIPRKTSSGSSNTNTKKPSTNTTTPKKEEKSKSSNNNLSGLTIENISFDFNKDTLEYNIDVQNVVENIQINAVAEDKTAKVEGIGTFTLNVGSNPIDIKVTAENGDIKTYKLNINRLEEIKEEVIEDKEEKPQVKEEKKSIKWYFWIIPGILVVAIISVVIILKKMNKTK